MAQDDGFIPVGEDDGFLPVETASSDGFVESKESFLDSLLHRESDYWAQTQAGVRQLPGYNKLTDWLSGAQTESKTGGVLDTVKAPGNILMGVLGMMDPVGTAGAEVGKRGWEATGEPGGEWGRVAAELVGGVAGGMGTAKLASMLPGVSPAVRAKLLMTPEVRQAMGSKIAPVAGTAESVIQDTGAAQAGLFSKTSPDLPQELDTVIREILPSGARSQLAEARAFLKKKGLSTDEREWAQQQIASIENKTIYKPEIVENFPAKQGSLLDSGEAGQMGLGETRVPASKGVIIREGEGVVGEYPTGRDVPLPGQLDQKGYQMELGLEMQGKTVRPAPSKTYAPDPALGAKITDWYMMNVQNPLIKSTGLLVTAPGTAIRNFMYQGYRYGVEVPIQALQEIIYTGSLEGAWQRASTQLSGLLDSPKFRQELFDVMERAPQETRSMLGRRGMIADYAEMPAADWYDKAVGPAQKWLNKANELQEKGYWYSNLSASINGQLAPLGHKLGETIRAGQLPQEMIDKAISHAFEMTYSSPMGDKLQKLYKAALEMPIVGLLANEFAPFARFNYSNALKEVIEMSPAGIIKARFNLHDQETAARQIAKSMVGTKMIEQFARLKEDPSLDVWEVPIPGYGKVDMRRWFPLSAYALIGELFNRPLGTKNSRVSGEDIESVLTGGTRIDDTAIGVLARMKDLSLQGVERGLGDSATTMMARWTTPFKGINDIYALATGDPNVMAARDVTTGKFGPFDKAAANIPGLRQMLPERIDPSLGPGERPGPRNRDEYASQLIGLDTVRSNKVKDELNRLKFTGAQGDDFLNTIYDKLRANGIDIKSPTSMEGSPTAGDFPRKMYASEGDKDLNRAMNTLMQDVGQPFLERFMSSEFYQKAPLDLRRFIISQWQTELKASFKKVAIAGGGPEVAMEQFVKDMSPVTRGFLDYMTVKE